MDFPGETAFLEPLARQARMDLLDMTVGMVQLVPLVRLGLWALPVRQAPREVRAPLVRVVVMVHLGQQVKPGLREV